MSEGGVDGLTIFPLFLQVVDSGDQCRKLIFLSLLFFNLSPSDFFLNILFEQPPIPIALLLRVFYFLLFLLILVLYGVQVIPVTGVHPYPMRPFLLTLPLCLWYQPLYLQSLVLVYTRLVLLFYIHTICTLLL